MGKAHPYFRRRGGSEAAGPTDGIRKFIVGAKAEIVLEECMTLKQQIHELVDDLPDDSPLLVEVRETLRMNLAIGEAMEDVREGRIYSSEKFIAKVQERWPGRVSG